ncbi:CDK-activating kinase assembly factor MAT1-domain-containing protein [Dipodascopsis tothii]|uniref:CDK-activating kinase assembly factor MAT1-domain-containing protein n=1 Tax=Dipodascopsis tothii TaxID=44089 RepID=UPI0034CD9199
MDGVTKPEDEFCPVCKLDSYMNPNMKFLINTECYHKMCAPCVDRIYSTGPAPCPYMNCKHILRKNRFKKQLFEDIGVEREVDIRRRVAKIFNKRQEEFDSLAEYNNYLEDVEGMVFNLVNRIDVEATEQRLESYQRENRAAILNNVSLASQEDARLEQLKRSEDEARLRARQAAIEEAEEEARCKKELERSIINNLASGSGDAETIVKRTARATLPVKPRADRWPVGAAAVPMAPRTSWDPSTDSEPFDPFDGDDYVNPLYTPASHYYDPFLDSIQRSVQAKAAGFFIEDVYRRSLFEAFMGLGCNIAVEKAAPPEPVEAA